MAGTSSGETSMAGATTTAASTGGASSGETGATSETGCMGDCCIDECFMGLGEAELLDSRPAHDIDHLWGVGFVVGNDDGVRLWGVDGVDGWGEVAFAATPAPVVALVGSYLEISGDTRGVAALCPEAGELRVYEVIDEQLMLVDTLAIPTGSVDLDTAAIVDNTLGELLVLDGEKAMLHLFEHTPGMFTELPKIELLGHPTALSARQGPDFNTTIAAIVEPTSSSLLLVEASDEVAADLDVVAVPGGPTDVLLSHFADVGGPSALVLSETASKTAMVSAQDDVWKVFVGESLEHPSRIAIGPYYEPFGVAAVLHRTLGQVSVGPFSHGEYSGIQAPLTAVTTLPGAQQLIVLGYADVAVVSPTDGLAIHPAF